MTVSRALRRLLHIRELEEEQTRLALDAARGELNKVDEALKAAAGQGRSGREMTVASAHSGVLTQRIAGLEQTRAAGNVGNALAIRLAEAERQVSQLRERFLSTRVQRRQAETLVDEADLRKAVEEARRYQNDLDNWHRSR
jgi:flagellar biosynthesis chaperone FliJ